MLPDAFLLIVITSYSIHYTKLYDSGSRRRRQRHCLSVPKVIPPQRNCCIVSHALLINIYCCVGTGSRCKAENRLWKPVNNHRQSRITSYNVCYTKLLRDDSTFTLFLLVPLHEGSVESYGDTNSMRLAEYLG